MRALLVVCMALALAGSASGSDRVMGRTVVIGDSLGVGTLPYLQQVLGGTVHGDVRVGRSSASGVSALPGLLHGGADRVIFDLGTNDASASQLASSVRRAKQIAGNRPIYIPTLNGPNADQKNALLRRLAGGNVHLVNWHYQSGGLVGPDGIHSTPAGYRKRAQIVAHSIASAPTSAVRSAASVAQPTAQGASMAPTDWLEQFFNGNRAQSSLLTAAAQHLGSAATPAQGAMATAANEVNENGSGAFGDVRHENSPQPTGPVGTPSRNILGPHGGAAYLLDQGAYKPGGLGGPDSTRGPFKRFAVSRDGKLVEAHDYGNGDVRFFSRKNPALLDAAAKASLARGGGAAAQQQQQAAIAAMPQADQERIRRLLGV